MRTVRDGLAVRMYRWLLRILPRSFRTEAEAELLEVYRDGLESAKRRGVTGVARYQLSVVLDLVVTSWLERRSLRQGITGVDGRRVQVQWTARWRADARQALRHMTRQPMRRVLGVITVGLGIGATVLVLVLVKGIVLNPLPFPEPERLVRLVEVDETGRRWWPSYPNLVDWREHATFFEGVAAAGVPVIEPIGLGTESVRASVAGVSRGFFETLRTEAQAGRLFSALENQADAEAVAVVSGSFWRSVLGGATPGDVELTIQGERYTVVGVLPSDFRFLGEAGAWSDASVLIPMDRTPPTWGRTSHGFHVVARVGEGVSLEQAQSRLNALAQQLADEHGEPTHAHTVRMTRLHDEITASVRRPLALLFGGALIVFVVACFNLAAMLLADGLSRTREMSVRLALGATRGDLFRNLLWHGGVLALPGAAAGGVIAWIGLWGIRLAGGQALPRLDEVSIDWTIFAAAALTAALFALAAGTIPALVLPSGDVEARLRNQRTNTATRGSRRLWASFIAGQVALTAALTFACGLLGRSFVAALNVDVGYDSADVLAIDVTLPESSHGEADRRLAYWQEALLRVRAIPGVTAASLTNILPHETSALVSGTTAEGSDEPMMFGGLRLVDADYFTVLGISPPAGASVAEWSRQPGAVLIDESLARRLWPQGNATGGRIENGFLSAAAPVAGVVGSVREWNQAEPSFGALYMDYRSAPERVRAMHIIVRSGIPLNTMAAQLRRTLTEYDSRVPITVAPLQHRVRDALSSRRLLLGLTFAFAATALALAAIGVYAIVAFVVAGGRKESGIRLVLGASTSRVQRRALMQGMRPVLLGLALGAAATPAAGGLLESQLFRVRPFDPLVFLLTIGVLALAATAGAWLPARRVARFQPALVLRDE